MVYIHTAFFICPSVSAKSPAYAGKRAGRAPKRRSRWDHPRTCGEKADAGADWLWDTGSPPHMQGKAKAYLEACFALRITPAHAGKRTLDAWHYADN